MLTYLEEFLWFSGKGTKKNMPTYAQWLIVNADFTMDFLWKCITDDRDFCPWANLDDMMSISQSLLYFYIWRFITQDNLPLTSSLRPVPSSDLDYSNAVVKILESTLNWLGRKKKKK